MKGKGGFNSKKSWALVAKNDRINAQRKLNERQKRQVKKIMKKPLELKYFYYFPPAVVAISTTMALIGVPFDVPQGIGDTQRVGDHLQWAGSIDFRFTLTAADTTNIVRVAIVQWKSQSTAAPIPTPSDFFLNGPTGAPDIWSPFSHDNRNSITVLFDRTFELIGNGTANFPVTNITQISRKYSVSLKKAAKEVQFNAAGGQGKNRLFLAYVSDSAVATHPTIQYTTKTFFRDG